MEYPVHGFEDLDCGQSSRKDVVSIVDTDGLDIALDSGLSEPVESFVADERGLLAFTRSNVFLIRGGGAAGEAITPTSFAVTRQSRIGCVDRCPAQSLQDVTLFTGPDGKGFYAVSYNNNREKYTTLEVSLTRSICFKDLEVKLLNSHLKMCLVLKLLEYKEMVASLYFRTTRLLRSMLSQLSRTRS